MDRTGRPLDIDTSRPGVARVYASTSADHPTSRPTREVLAVLPDMP